MSMSSGERCPSSGTPRSFSPGSPSIRLRALWVPSGAGQVIRSIWVTARRVELIRQGWAPGIPRRLVHRGVRPSHREIPWGHRQVRQGHQEVSQGQQEGRGQPGIAPVQTGRRAVRTGAVRTGAVSTSRSQAIAKWATEELAQEQVDDVNHPRTRWIVTDTRRSLWPKSQTPKRPIRHDVRHAYCLSPSHPLRPRRPDPHRLQQRFPRLRRPELLQFVRLAAGGNGSQLAAAVGKVIEVDGAKAKVVCPDFKGQEGSAGTSIGVSGDTVDCQATVTPAAGPQYKTSIRVTWNDDEGTSRRLSRTTEQGEQNERRRPELSPGPRGGQPQAGEVPPRPSPSGGAELGRSPPAAG